MKRESSVGEGLTIYGFGVGRDGPFRSRLSASCSPIEWARRRTHSDLPSQAAKPRLDVVAQRFINEGRFPGPRYLAAGPEITTVGGLGDSAPSHIPHPGLNLGLVVSGPEEVRRTRRQLIT